MNDELKLFDLLFSNTYESRMTYEGWSEDELYDLDIDISEKLEVEFDRIRGLYFEIASGRESIEKLKFMFAFRFNRLLKFKTKLETILEGHLHTMIILGEDCGLLTTYNNYLSAYKGVSGLLSLIIDDLYVVMDVIADRQTLDVKYQRLSSRQIKKWYDELRENYSVEQNSVIVDGMTIDLTDCKGSIPGIDFVKDTDHEDIDAQEYISRESTPKTFDNYMKGVHLLLRTYSRNSLDERSLYEALTSTLSDLLKSNKLNREEDILNFLIETNVAEQETYEFVVQRVEHELFDKSKDEKYEILKKNHSIFNNLLERSRYRKINRLNIVSLVNMTLPRLIEFTEKEMTKYESLKFDNKVNSISNEKIKTKLTVPQISLLFKLLSDDKVIECDNVTKLSKQISSTFSSKQKDDISDKSVKNNFDSPENDAINFWKIKLGRLKQLLENY